MEGSLITGHNLSKEKPIVCSVVTELQAAQVAKICQDYDIQAIIRLKPYVDISQVKKVLMAKTKEILYDPCRCGSGKKFKFCCYKKDIELVL